METALKTLNFGPEALWITLGTLVAMAALALLALQLVSHIRALRQPGLASDQHLHEQLRSDHDRLSALERATTRQTGFCVAALVRCSAPRWVMAM